MNKFSALEIMIQLRNSLSHLFYRKDNLVEEPSSTPIIFACEGYYNMFAERHKDFSFALFTHFYLPLSVKTNLGSSVMLHCRLPSCKNQTRHHRLF